MSDRYARQMVLPEVGAAGQARLAAASVVVVGAGGLGCPVLQYLAGAGVGRLTIVDHDRVEETNLHRQPLYAMADIGKLKAEAAAAALRRFNPGDRRRGRGRAPDAAERGGAGRRRRSCGRCRRQLRRHLRAERRLPGRRQAAGQRVGDRHDRLRRRLLRRRPELPRGLSRRSVEGGTCATVGVLGTAVAVLGGVQAHLALHLLLGLEPTVLGRVITFDARRLAFGGFGFAGSPEPERFVPFIAPASVTADDLVVDLRSLEEAPQSPFAGARRLDVDHVAALLAEPPSARRIVLCCRSGQRALAAADRLREGGLDNLALVALG